jgi:hypothetical protein
MTNLNSTAPHIHDAVSYDDLVDWGPQRDALPAPGGATSHSRGRLLFKTPVRRPETGLWVCTQGRWKLAVPRDEFLWVMSGRATYSGKNGGTLSVGPGQAVLFPAGWSGEASVAETLRVTYILSGSEPTESTPKAPKLLANPLALKELKDWGLIPTMIQGESRTAGVLLNREADQTAECGFWTCTPGTWHCHVTTDEYCHFLAGRSTYTHGETGEVIEIRPDTVAFFPKDWKGTCVVHETVKKVYLIL